MPQGPSAWLQRVPISDRFRFFVPDDYVTALSLDLLLCPPQLVAAPACTHCASAGRSHLHTPYGRHYVPCPHGIRLHTTVHDHVRDALVAVLTAALGERRVIAERTGAGGHTAMQRWMRGYGSGLPKQPDIVLADLDGRESFVIVDVKTIDPAGSSALSTLHTDSSRLAHHDRVARQSAVDYFGSPPSPPPGMRVRHVAFAVSTFGSLGTDAQALLELVSRTAGDAVPRSLLSELSWSTSSFTRFARQAVTMEIRRSLASSLRGLEPAVAARVAQAAAPPLGGAPSGPDSVFDVFVPRVDGVSGPSGVVDHAVSGVDVRAPVAQAAGP